MNRNWWFAAVAFALLMLSGCGDASDEHAHGEHEHSGAQEREHDHHDHEGHEHHEHEHDGHDGSNDHDHEAREGHEGHEGYEGHEGHEGHEDHELSDGADHALTDAMENGETGSYWTCPMHPQIREEGPGSCPICGMDLVERGGAEHDHEPDQVHVRSGVQQQMNLRTIEARRDRLWRRIDTMATADYDESRLHHLHPRVEGWIQQMNVSARGEPVEEGQLLFTLYSPDLVDAQEDFLQALRRGDPGIIASARERLQALGVQQRFVDTLAERREVVQAVPWHATMDGVVTVLGARHGMHVQPGEVILEVANLERLWITARVFDRHADWLAEDQPAEIEFSALPGERFRTRVEYIYPELEDNTRTLRVRLPLDNEDRRLKPGMWSAARIYAGPVDDQLIIPREALIRTGHSARVVIREDDVHFRIREVIPGMESGDWVAIREGLEAGEEVVRSGQFLIDSEASLQGGHGRMEGHDH